MLNPTTFCRAVFLFMLGGAVSLAAQAQRLLPSTKLSASCRFQLSRESVPFAQRYTNEYFDFAFELPPDAHLRPQALPASRNGNIQVLELAGPPPADAEISIIGDSNRDWQQAGCEGLPARVARSGTVSRRRRTARAEQGEFCADTNSICSKRVAASSST